MATDPHREELSAALKQYTGIQNLYFQPPSTVRMKYPCIQYKFESFDQRHADNLVYTTRKKWLLTLITDDPDNEYVDKLAELPMCRFDRAFTADNLYHYVFELYY